MEAWDISEEALRTAESNAKALKAEVAFCKRDALRAEESCSRETWEASFSCKPSIPSKPNAPWDLIVSNPPYICDSERAAMDDNVLLHEPHTALFVPDDDPLRFYRAIARYALSSLSNGGSLLFECNKVRAYVFFRGRSILFKEQGEVLLLRFANDLEEYAKVEQLPKLDGKKMFLYLAPKKAGVVKKSQQKMDREKREAEARSAKDAENGVEEMPTNGGLLANAKVSAEALKALKGEK